MSEIKLPLPPSIDRWSPTSFGEFLGMRRGDDGGYVAYEDHTKSLFAYARAVVEVDRVARMLDKSDTLKDAAPQQPVDEPASPDDMMVYRAIADRYHSDRAALSAPQAAQAVPQGWKLVPVEPTEEMVQIGKHAAPYRAIDVYRAMLAAAPSAPAARREPNDTERLDWLEAQNANLDSDAWVVLGHDCKAEEDYRKYWVGANLRRAIDTARRAAQRKGASNG